LTVLCQVLLALSPALGEEDGWKQKTKEDGRVVQELKIEAPAMTEEDQYGYVMPERYRCDSCRAVMFHVVADLRKKQPKSRRLKQWEYTDVFDDTCRSGFEGYGIKLVNGENALSGPALRQDDSLTPGSGAIQMGGETWNKRLGETCRKTIYEKVGEEEVYEMFYKHFKDESDEAETSKALVQEICFSELKDCHAGPKPPPKAKDSEEKPDKAKKKEKAKKEKTSKAKAKASAEAENKAARKAEDSAPPAAQAATGSNGEKVGVEAFLRQLAVRHGLTSDEYLAARTPKEWEKLTVAIAGRLFNGKSDEL